MRTASYEGGDRRAARRTLSQAASVMLRLTHEIEAQGPVMCLDGETLRQDLLVGRYLLTARLIAGRYCVDWEALALRT